MERGREGGGEGERERTEGGKNMEATKPKDTVKQVEQQHNEDPHKYMSQGKINNN